MSTHDRASAQRLAATIGTVVVAVATHLAVGFGMMSPMATAGCSQGSSDPVCVNEGTYPLVLTVGPVVLAAAALGAVWFRATRRPRLAWFAPWACLLATIFVWGNSLAGGALF